MTESPWKPGTATAIGSMPGSDPLEAARLVSGTFPELTPMPELPARGVGADMLGRTAGMLLDLPVEVVPSGYRVATHPGRDQRRAADLLRWDLDALQTVAESEGAPERVKIQAAGPWTLAAGIELVRGHRVLTDHGALRDFTDSLVEGVVQHVTQVSARSSAPVVVQLDEPALPAVLAGDLPTPSGYGTVPAVPEPEAEGLLAGVLDRLNRAVGAPVIVHCCAPRPPVSLLRRSGAGAIAFDATAAGSFPGALADELGEAWEEGTVLFLGLVPTGPSSPSPVTPSLADVAAPARELVARLGFDRRFLAERAVPTPTCGLAGSSSQWARLALNRAVELGRMFRDEAYG